MYVINSETLLLFILTLCWKNINKGFNKTAINKPKKTGRHIFIIVDKPFSKYKNLKISTYTINIGISIKKFLFFIAISLKLNNF